MQRSFILWLVFAVLVAAFAVGNAGTVPVNLFSGQVDISLALLVVIPLFVGAGLGFALDLPRRLKSRKRIKELEQRLLKLETDTTSSRGGVEGSASSGAASEPQ